MVTREEKNRGRATAVAFKRKKLDSQYRTAQKRNPQKSGCDHGVKIELKQVLAKFNANVPAHRILLSGLQVT